MVLLWTDCGMVSNYLSLPHEWYLLVVGYCWSCPWKGEFHGDLRMIHGWKAPSGVFRVSCTMTQRAELHWTWWLRSLECENDVIQRRWRSMMRSLRCWPRWGCVNLPLQKPTKNDPKKHVLSGMKLNLSSVVNTRGFHVFRTYTKVMKRKKVELEQLGA